MLFRERSYLRGVAALEYRQSLPALHCFEIGAVFVTEFRDIDLDEPDD